MKHRHAKHGEWIIERDDNGWWVSHPSWIKLADIWLKKDEFPTLKSVRKQIDTYADAWHKIYAETREKYQGYIRMEKAE